MPPIVRISCRPGQAVFEQIHRRKGDGAKKATTTTITKIGNRESIQLFCKSMNFKTYFTFFLTKGVSASFLCLKEWGMSWLDDTVQIDFPLPRYVQMVIDELEEADRNKDFGLWFNCVDQLDVACKNTGVSERQRQLLCKKYSLNKCCDQTKE